MSWGAGLAAALLVILPRPASWIVGLAAFLVRGGILLFLLPIVVLPSPVGLANILGPTVATFWLGGMSLGFATLVTAIFAAFFVWLIVGGWVAAVTERDLIELVVADDDLGAGGSIPNPSPVRRPPRPSGFRFSCPTAPGTSKRSSCCPASSCSWSPRVGRNRSRSIAIPAR